MTSSPRSHLVADVRRDILRWAATLDRPLPWRGERDPWRILVSEVMLQQTQAGRVASVYEAFLARFPTPSVMAAAEPAEVIAAWGTLGYPRRALNLWRCARAIVDRGWPAGVDGLVSLPGVGPYTARAVASFAFGADVAAVDANVRRVVTRLFGGCDAQAQADALVPRNKAHVWNQAMIDLGAVICTARSPRCDGCPVRARCEWSPSPAVAKPRTQRFQDTMRFARGRVLAVLRSDGSSTHAALRRTTGLDATRLRDAVAGLEADGLAHRRGRAIALGPAAASRR